MRAIRDDDAAITGAGLVTPLGFGVGTVLAALAAGRAAGSTVGNDGDPAGTRRAALVDEPWLREPIPEEHAAQAKFLTGSGQMAVTAVREALAEARLPDGPTPDPSRGLFLAQMDWMSIEYADFRPVFEEATDGFTREPTAEGLHTATVRKLNPFYLLDTLNNNAYSFVTALLGWMGPGTSLSGPTGPGLLATSMAARAIRRGDAQAMLAVGAGRWTGPVARLERSRHFADTPTSSPTIPAEGAAAVVMEPFDAARGRSAPVSAVVLGWGAGFGDPADNTALETAIDAALDDAGISRRKPPAFSGPDPDELLRRDVAPTGPRYRLGDMGPASDVADAILAAKAVVPGRPALVVARGIDGQVTALVLARPS